MRKDEKVKEFLENNYGYISTNDFLKLKVNKPSIKKYIDNGLVVKVAHGLYMDSTQDEDEYYILQFKYPSVVFSYYTALNILNLTNRVPSKLEVTVPKDKKVLGDYMVHHVSAKKYNIGIIEVSSPYGNPIRIYNAERCICDILKNSDTDLELQNRILNYYFNSNIKNIELLLQYAKIFNIYEKVNTIVEVYMKC